VENFRADGSCWVRIRRRERPMRGRVAQSAERSAAFARVLKTRPYAQAYEERSTLLGRQMPIVMLEALDSRGEVG
jgi:hypothetical protein